MSAEADVSSLQAAIKAFEAQDDAKAIRTNLESQLEPKMLTLKECNKEIEKLDKKDSGERVKINKARLEREQKVGGLDLDMLEFVLEEGMACRDKDYVVKGKRRKTSGPFV
jgi:hypothetical protein